VSARSSSHLQAVRGTAVNYVALAVADSLIKSFQLGDGSHQRGVTTTIRKTSSCAAQRPNCPGTVPDQRAWVTQGAVRGRPLRTLLTNTLMEVVKSCALFLAFAVFLLRAQPIRGTATLVSIRS